MRRAVTGANNRCYVATALGRPAPAAQVEGLSAVLVGWRRMMSSAAEPTSSPPSSVKNNESLEEKAEKDEKIEDEDLLSRFIDKSENISDEFQSRVVITFILVIRDTTMSALSYYPHM
ncbi:hypothetical protein SASPL_117901 [Salvia splendens]|uniref:Uncharacterized protein n=1 Tax=Salvia splendens TaxID=180675 RepID=A0A8X8XVR9_SALSN|nr:hypothetical protein SASPL_117901 [Salvia splendens]